MSPIDEQDRNIASIKRFISELKGQLSDISRRKEDANREAMAAVKARNRDAAICHLRARKRQEVLFDRRTETYLELENVYNKIEEAASQVEVLAALKAGSNVLHNLNAEIGGADSVDIVLEGLRKEMADAEDIGSLLGQDAQLGGIDDATEIDSELEALDSEIRKVGTEDKAALEVAKRLNVLNHLPTAQPQNRGSERSEGSESQGDRVQNHYTDHSGMSSKEGRGNNDDSVSRVAESATS